MATRAFGVTPSKAITSITRIPYFYTYSVTNGAGTNEVCDPYAKATGINGRRAAILDFASLRETGSAGTRWQVNLPTITSPNQLSVYEAHVRDLTADKTWKSQCRATATAPITPSAKLGRLTPMVPARLRVKTGPRQHQPK
jgi:pullulanase/glycogen debranching enzyme